MKHYLLASMIVILMGGYSVSALSIVEAITVGDSSPQSRSSTTFTTTSSLPRAVVNEGAVDRSLSYSVVMSLGTPATTSSSSNYFNQYYSNTSSVSNGPYGLVNTSSSALLSPGGSGANRYDTITTVGQYQVIHNANRYYIASSSGMRISSTDYTQHELYQGIVDGRTNIIVFRNKVDQTYDIVYSNDLKLQGMTKISDYRFMPGFESGYVGQNTLITKEETENRWTYRIFVPRSGLDGSFFSANNQLPEYERYFVVAQDRSFTVGQSSQPYYYPTVYNGTTPNRRNTIIQHSAVLMPLNFTITYTLGNKDRNGYYPLINPRCTSNGSVNVFFIQQLNHTAAYGIGLEINTGMGSQSYKVQSGDKLCCNALRYTDNQKVGGCKVIL